MERREEEKVEAIRRKLKTLYSKTPSNVGQMEAEGSITGLSILHMQVIKLETGRALCTLKVPKHLADQNGYWQAGAIATLIDAVGVTIIQYSTEQNSVSIDLDISYFSPAQIEDEVEIEVRVLDQKGRLSAVVVEIRKKASGELVALGKQWLLATIGSRSKL